MRRCPRLLALQQVVASPRAKDPVRHEAYILKQLQQVSAWQGSLVHTVLAAGFVPAVRLGQPMDPSALTAAARELARAQLAFSQAKRFRAPKQTKVAAGAAYCALADDDRGNGLAPERLADVDRAIERCFNNLAAQQSFLEVVARGRSHLAEVRLTFPLDDIHVTAMLDLLFEAPNQRLAIVDWKVGESETSDYRRQLQIYALTALRSPQSPGFGRSPEQLDVYEVQLLKNRVTQHVFDRDDIEDAEDFVYRSGMEMQSLIGGITYAGLDLDDFDVAARPNTCAYCALAPLCVDLFTQAGNTPGAAGIQGRLL
jgi:PD-(D/E)XK nuclease superfamily